MSGRSEKAILNDTLCAVSAVDHTCVWRNNTGQAWAGKRVYAYPGTNIPVLHGTVVLVGAQPVTFGVPGSGDILGAAAGVPLSIEVKTESGRQSEQQKAFQAAWERAGGVYILARDPVIARREVESLVLLAP